MTDEKDLKEALRKLLEIAVDIAPADERKPASAMQALIDIGEKSGADPHRHLVDCLYTATKIMDDQQVLELITKTAERQGYGVEVIPVTPSDTTH